MSRRDPGFHCACQARADLSVRAVDSAGDAWAARGPRLVAAALEPLTPDQQYIIQSSSPISIVAAMIPNASAARNAVLPPLSSFIRRSLQSISAALVPLAAAALATFAVACTEATAPPGRQFPVLDDV